MAAARVRTAFVMGAGLGSRLRPLTDSRPKPLVPVFNRPLVTFALDHLLSVGVEKFVINTHHLAERWAEFFPESSYRGSKIDFVFEPELLETGGGIANAAARLGDEPFFVYSGDILTDVDLSKLAEAHFRGGCAVTVGLRRTGLSTAIACRDGRVTDFKGRHGEEGEYDFANVSVWTPEAVGWLPPAERKAPFFPVLAERLAEGSVGGVELHENGWFNVGTRGEYLRAHSEEWVARASGSQDFPRKEASATVDASARLLGKTVVGARSRIGAGAELRDCIVWDDVVVEAGARLDRCVVRDFQVASGSRSGEDI